MGDFELLVVDDGSTDGAVDEIRAIGDPRIRVIGDMHRRGLSARLNEGIQMARGRYIARMDADDIAFPQRFEKQVHFLDANPEIDLAGTRGVVFRMVDGQMRIIGLLPFAPCHEEICAKPWRGFPLPHPTWMGRASWFRRFRYAMPEVGRAEDQELLLRSHAQSRFACLDEVLLGYRQGPYKLSRTLGARWRILKEQEKYFWEHRQWKAAFLALVLGCLKVVVDLLAAMPGCDGLFFARMAAPVPAPIGEKLQRAKLAAEAV